MISRIGWLSFIFIAAIFFFSKEVHMSQVFFENADLDAVVASANLIVMAERKGRVEARHDSTDTFLVREILWGNTVKAGATLQVLDANASFHQAIEAHLKEHGYQGAPSPIFQRYESSAPGGAKELILFLSVWKEKEMKCRYVMEGSFEGLEKKSLVVSLISKIKKP